MKCFVMYRGQPFRPEKIKAEDKRRIKWCLVLKDST